jgi:hypothetical protein
LRRRRRATAISTSPPAETINVAGSGTMP